MSCYVSEVTERLENVFFTMFLELNLLPSSAEGFVVRKTVYFIFYFTGFAVTGIRTCELFRLSLLWITSPEL